ncbi:MAG: ABC transporter ATP-binding protein [Candidatus Nanopelagicales bacterium]
MDGNADPMIRLAQVSKQYADGTVAVHDLDLDIGLGEICALVGPSGCGKTTTMRMINRLVEPTAGHVYVGGEDVTQMDVKELRRHIGYVIQAVGLFPHYTVRRNIGTVCNLLGWDKARTAARADELLDLVGLDPSVYGDRYPHQLSGGQRQRVGVARALAADPPVLLMDEPFGAVDPIARDNLQEQFLALHAEVRKTVVLVTHDIDEAVRMADRIAVMRQGGYLEQYAAPAELLAHPVNDFVADFVGSDRTLKRLAVTPLPVLPDGAPAGLPAIAAEASLAEALTALLESPEGKVAVTTDGAARLLTLADVHSALRDAA